MACTCVCDSFFFLRSLGFSFSLVVFLFGGGGDGRYGVVAVRGAEVYELADEDGNLLNDPAAEKERVSVRARYSLLSPWLAHLFRSVRSRASFDSESDPSRES